MCIDMDISKCNDCIGMKDHGCYCESQGGKHLNPLMKKKWVITVSPLFAWYDMWIGFYWDRKTQWLYCMVLTVGIIIKFDYKYE